MKPKHAIIGAAVILGVLAIPMLMSARKTLEPPVDINIYSQIQYTSTYPAIVDLIGREGIQVPMTIEKAMELKNIEGRLLGRMGNEGFEVYAWKNTRGTARGNDPRIYVFFANGRVVAKTQVGLN
jgi:hypothetical protein